MRIFRFCPLACVDIVYASFFSKPFVSLNFPFFFFLRITISISSSCLHQSFNSLSFPCSFQNTLKVSVPSVMCSASSSSSSSNRFCFPPHSVLPLAMKVIIGLNHGQPYYPISQILVIGQRFLYGYSMPHRSLRDCHQAVGPKEAFSFHWNS